jgi:hypothetical protein
MSVKPPSLNQLDPTSTAPSLPSWVIFPVEVSPQRPKKLHQSRIRLSIARNTFRRRKKLKRAESSLNSSRRSISSTLSQVRVRQQQRIPGKTTILTILTSVLRRVPALSRGALISLQVKAQPK